MQIQVNVDHGVDGSAALTAHVETVVKRSLHHLEDHLTRVEVHLDAESGGKVGGDDKRCMMEARPAHRRPVVVSHKADNIHQAVDGAARKLKSSLEHLFGKLEDRHRHSRTDEAGSFERELVSASDASAVVSARSQDGEPGSPDESAGEA